MIHLCSAHDLDLLSDPDHQNELFPDRVLVIVVGHLGVCKRCALGLEMAREVGQVAGTGLGQGELVGFVALRISS